MSSAGNAFMDYQNAKVDSQVLFIKFTVILISIVYIVSFILSFTPIEIGVPILEDGGKVSAPFRIPLLIVLIVGIVLLWKSKSALDNIKPTSTKEEIEKATKDSNKYAAWGYILNILGVCASTYLMFNY